MSDTIVTGMRDIDIKCIGCSANIACDKLLIHFCPTGSAPILKKTKFALPATDPNLPFSHLHKFLRKQLKLEPENALFLYVNSAFGPGMNERLVDLRACFGNAKGELIVNYCLEEAWG
ncbi:hypothetical protein ScalyP_jg5058 [Parmales sp. scaly parma]|nr:hypothetical protein ScalyP_jg5058 [Parmales sp. scaly parma]